MLAASVVAAAAFIPVFAQDKHDHKGKDDHQHHAAAAPTHAGFERFKRLAGDWIAQGSHGDQVMNDVAVNYRVTAAGSAVMETLFAGTEHEMITMYTMDGDNLVLTHYCAMGNQPRMKAEPISTDDPDTIKFACDGKGGNMKETDAHMHAATFTFIDDDTFKNVWAMHADGKPLDEAKFEFKRKQAQPIGR